MKQKLPGNNNATIMTLLTLLKYENEFRLIVVNIPQ